MQLSPCRAGSMQGSHKSACTPWPWGHQLILHLLLCKGVHIAAPLRSCLLIAYDNHATLKRGGGKRERTPQTMIASIKIAQSDPITFSGHVDKTVSLENPSLRISYCRQSGDHAHQKARCEIPQRSPQSELKITSGNQGEYCVFLRGVGDSPHIKTGYKKVLMTLIDLMWLVCSTAVLSFCCL